MPSVTHGDGVRADREIVKHIVFINRSYWPDAEATGQLLTELAEDLSSSFRVSVVCGQPVANPEQAAFCRSGRQFRNGVEICRVRHTRFRKSSFLGRAINMVTFLLAASWRMLTLPHPDVLVVETDPPLLCLLGRTMQLLRRTRLVCYLQDIYPDVAVALGKLRPGIVSRLADWLFYRVYRRADRVVVLSRDMQRHLRERGIAAERLCTIPNWVDAQRIAPVAPPNAFRQSLGLGERQFLVMYSGNLGLSQRLEQLIEAAHLLRSQPEFQFVLIGGGANRPPLEARARELNLSNVRFLDYQPKPRLAESLSAADLHIVFLDPRITHCLMPSKIYGILAAGVPVLLLGAPHSELAELIQQQRVGRVVSGERAVAIAQAIQELAADTEFRREAAVRARDLAVERFDRRVAVEAFHNLLQETIGAEWRNAPRRDPPRNQHQSPGHTSLLVTPAALDSESRATEVG